MKKDVGLVGIVVAVAYAKLRVFIAGLYVDLISCYVRAFSNAHVGRVRLLDEISFTRGRQAKNFQRQNTEVPNGEILRFHGEGMWRLAAKLKGARPDSVLTFVNFNKVLAACLLYVVASPGDHCFRRLIGHNFGSARSRNILAFQRRQFGDHAVVLFFVRADAHLAALTAIHHGRAPQSSLSVRFRF